MQYIWCKQADETQKHLLTQCPNVQHLKTNLDYNKIMCDNQSNIRMEATIIQVLRDHISNTDKTAIKPNINVNSNQEKKYILKQYHMWRTSLCVRTGDPGTHNQLIYKNNQSLSRGCAPRGSHIT